MSDWYVPHCRNTFYHFYLAPNRLLEVSPMTAIITVPAYGENKLIDEILWDVFVTALEGGIGYWAASSSYHIWFPGFAHADSPDREGFYSDVVDAEYGDHPNAEFPPTRINRAVIAKGFEVMAAGPVEGLHDDYRSKFVMLVQAALANDKERVDDVDYDAYDASALVQAGMFGKVIFG